MAVNSNHIPEKINDYNVYLDGVIGIGMGDSMDLPEPKMKSSTITGVGIAGEIDSPTIGQFESLEIEVPFNTLYSNFVDMLSPLKSVNLTIRAAQQVYDKDGGYIFKGLRAVIKGRVKSFKPGKVQKGEAMEASVTVECTYYMLENDGKQLVEIDKLNGIYNVGGQDMLAEVKALI